MSAQIKSSKVTMPVSGCRRNIYQLNAWCVYDLFTCYREIL